MQHSHAFCANVACINRGRLTLVLKVFCMLNTPQIYFVTCKFIKYSQFDVHTTEWTPGLIHTVVLGALKQCRVNELILSLTEQHMIRTWIFPIKSLIFSPVCHRTPDHSKSKTGECGSVCWCGNISTKLLSDPTHFVHDCYELLPSGRRYRMPTVKTQRFLKSFIPSSIKYLNQPHTKYSLNYHILYRCQCNVVLSYLLIN